MLPVSQSVTPGGDVRIYTPAELTELATTVGYSVERCTPLESERYSSCRTAEASGALMSSRVFNRSAAPVGGRSAKEARAALSLAGHHTYAARSEAAHDT
jgi:hypothetical protein